MTNEIYWLVLSILVTSLLWVPYIVNRLFEYGILVGLWDPEGITDTNVKWSRRLMAAHVNAVENLVIFAPLVILIHVLELNNAFTESASILFFIARLLHVVLFTLKVPVLRIVAFLSGFAAQMMLVFTLLTVN